MFNDFIAHKFAIHRRYFTLDDLSRVVRFSLLLCSLSDSFQHGFPFCVGDFDFLDRPCVVHVTVNRDSFHGCPAVGFQWYA